MTTGAANLTQILADALNIASNVATGQEVQALASIVNLLEQGFALVAGPIDASSLAPTDRAQVDAEINAEVSKT